MSAGAGELLGGRAGRETGSAAQLPSAAAGRAEQRAQASSLAS
jgi:hypothetical protein